MLLTRLNARQAADRGQFGKCTYMQSLLDQSPIEKVTTLVSSSLSLPKGRLLSMTQCEQRMLQRRNLSALREERKSSYHTMRQVLMRISRKTHWIQDSEI